jgi:magnesium transporter
LTPGHAAAAAAFAARARVPPDTSWWSLAAAMALVLPALGGGDCFARLARDLPTPRVAALRRLRWQVTALVVLLCGVSGFLYSGSRAFDAGGAWVSAPLVGLASELAGPHWLRDLYSTLVAVAAILVLVPAAWAATRDGAQTMRWLSSQGALPERLGAAHPRLGTPAQAIDVATIASVLIVVASGARVTWLASAYAVSLVAGLLLRVGSTAGVRPASQADGTRPSPTAGTPGGLSPAAALLAIVAAVPVLALLSLGNIAALSACALIAGLALVVKSTAPAATPADVDAFEFLSASDFAVGEVEARPGNVLVCVRNPHGLAHLAGALDRAGDREVVAMTVRLLGLDVEDEHASRTSPTRAETELLSAVVAVAERHRRPVRLLVVPAKDAFEAIAAEVLRLRSSEVHVGESASLSAADQARLLGEAWERAQPPDDRRVQLAVHHRSGRTDVFHLGAHPPSLTSSDLDLIHRLWLDATKAIGPHVHHHDVVRAALTQMDQQLNGAQREVALAAIRDVTRPAEDLAAAVRAGDYARLRDVTRNRHAGEIASLLPQLGLEDQVVVFRVLPRRAAAAVFEYLSHDEQAALLKTMAKEDVAAILNTMAPDDRTMFLEELPATATRQLLELLSPAERAVAATLLGYPEDSIGRLMTPQYIAVPEHWTVREVLDHIRTHGQDSETLNVIYVVDSNGQLIDDIRIRELLLTALDQRVSELMDRRFVALKATDPQTDAVALFRKYDRSAMPVTDSAGALIGIVTIDDVLDVAEATATEEIQRIGGSEALDEPYMEIRFWRMVQKRAGWLTALFLGEMLTATAMGMFEEEIAKAVVLALFVPLIISSGGNSGSQASTLVIRALALGEVGLRDWWRVMRREVLAGLTLGAILGGIGFLRISLTSAFSDVYGPHWFLIALTVAITLVGIVLWGTVIGSLLPFLARRLGFDPATSSAPFVATLVDVTGLLIYFSVALFLLRGALL